MKRLINEDQTRATNALNLIRAKTIYYDRSCVAPDARRRRAITAAVADYRRRNRRGGQLQAQFFHLNKPLEVLPESEFDAGSLRSSSRWYQYLHGSVHYVIELSQVGFNRQKTVAVLYREQNCGPLCSGGELRVLEKVAGHWQALEPGGLLCAWNS